MRHTFSFPVHIRESVKSHIRKAIKRISSERYRQEQPYIAALASQLEGKVYEDNDGYVGIKSTIVNDRGKHSAESMTGADLAITATIGDPDKKIDKAILIQAKMSQVKSMPPSALKYLVKQLSRMKNHTNAPKVMEVVDIDGKRFPRIISGNRILSLQSYQSLNLEDYFVRRVLTTLDGDTRPDFVEAVQDSTLTRLNLLAKLTSKLSDNEKHVRK